MNEYPSSAGQPLLVIVVNNQALLEYDRNKTLHDRQLASLEGMDRKMDQGIQLGKDWIESPDQPQRAQFVAIHLIEALQQGEDALIAAFCAYLACRLPELKQVRAQQMNGGFSIDLIFDRVYTKENTISFVPSPSSGLSS